MTDWSSRLKVKWTSQATERIGLSLREEARRRLLPVMLADLSVILRTPWPKTYLCSHRLSSI